MTDLCVFCKSSDNSDMYPTTDIWGNHYILKRCHTCRAVFLTPFPSQGMLAEAYDESYYGCTEKKFKGPVEKVLDIFRRQRARKVSKLLPQGGAVLDMGCGNGYFLMSLLKYGTYRLYGSELDGKSAQRASQFKEINLTTQKLTAKSFQAGTFDVITLFHVFEHLTEPKEMLSQIIRFLKTDGHLVVSFPNIGSFQSRLFKGNWLHLDPPRHLFFFEMDHFEQLMKFHHFELIHKNTFSAEQNPYGFIQSFLNLFCKKREILFESLKGNNTYLKGYPKYKLLLQKLFFALVFPFAILGDALMSVFGKGATVEFVFRKKGVK